MRFVKLLSYFKESDMVMEAVCSMDADVAFKLLSVDLNVNKVMGVLASIVVAVLFTLGPKIVE